MERSIAILKEKKMRITPQRVAVYEALSGQNNHLTAEQIYGKIKTKFPAISLATVYSILELFKREKLINEIRICFDRSYFEIGVTPHHHFLCKQCRHTFDIDIPLCSALREHNIDGFLIEEFQGYFYGICKRCCRR